MSFNEYFNRFCLEHGYIGKLGLHETSKEYEIIISKGNDNAGAYLTKEELKSMSNQEIRNLLALLHRGFESKFNAKNTAE
ncbi:hypothetical protein [Anaerocolumna sp. MB42-C2]|uniref:hypothetical protein n=1 Tax=Anaerocolumna sp. MB42-C2 TaxID=3070997 RepID=UPI0027DF61E5|nr:hypothetical protein [Anaerocolumna sp. MB42-C2]WMJ87804.1 hypothetical protein RBU59_27875 [Anaerocolumna sp. MB42-C2]